MLQTIHTHVRMKVCGNPDLNEIISTGTLLFSQDSFLCLLQPFIVYTGYQLPRLKSVNQLFKNSKAFLHLSGALRVLC